MSVTHTLCVEVLHHFQCGDCNQWWTIGDYRPSREREQLCCPKCGTRARYEEVAKVKEAQGVLK